MTKRIVVQEDYNVGNLPEAWIDIYKAGPTAHRTALDDAKLFLQETINHNGIKKTRKFRIVELTQEVVFEQSIDGVGNE